jgi:hypothetical protein
MLEAQSESQLTARIKNVLLPSVLLSGVSYFKQLTLKMFLLPSVLLSGVSHSKQLT